MEEMEIDGKTYLSSKKAAQITGYAKDYVGQLCREGRVTAKLIGRSWYVSEDSIKSHRFGAEKEKDETSTEGDVLEGAHKEEEKDTTKDASEITNKQATWEAPTYVPGFAEEVVPLAYKDIHNEQPSVDIDAMQSAWKEWFDRMPEAKEEKVPDTYELKAQQNQDEESIEEDDNEIVPIHRMVPSKPPAHPQEMDVVAVPKTTYVSSYTQNPTEIIESYKAPETMPIHTKHQGKEVRYLSIKALCVAAILILVSLTFVALGVRTPFAPTSGSTIPLIEYLEGQTRI